MKLLFVGDVMLGRLVNEKLKSVPPEYPWGDTLKIFKDSDFRICNLECVISDRGMPWTETPKVFHYRMDEKNIRALSSAGINGVSLANNHVLDYGEVALMDCLRILDDNLILHSGSGEDRIAAEKPFDVNVGGIRIGFIAFTDNEPEWAALDDRAGVFYQPVDVHDERTSALKVLVARYRRDVDVLVVSAHWGGNWGCYPPEEHRDFAHLLIDAGADIIFGHSPHVFRGIEIYHARPILYSAGDFIDDYAVDLTERNDQSFIFIVEIIGGNVRRILLYPTLINQFQANLAQGSEARAIMDRMQYLCSVLGPHALQEGDHLVIYI